MGILGRVDVLRLFLQQVNEFLYKAVPMQCGYSTQIGDNAVEMFINLLPEGFNSVNLTLCCIHGCMYLSFAWSKKLVLVYYIEKLCYFPRVAIRIY